MSRANRFEARRSIFAVTTVLSKSPGRSVVGSIVRKQKTLLIAKGSPWENDYVESFNVDFFLKGRPFDLDSMKRAEPGQVNLDSDFEIPIASPEDTILSKLDWYRLGNEVSERQWNDVVRVMRILGNKADVEDLKRNAADLKVAGLLQRLLNSAI